LLQDRARIFIGRQCARMQQATPCSSLPGAACSAAELRPKELHMCSLEPQWQRKHAHNRHEAPIMSMASTCLRVEPRDKLRGLAQVPAHKLNRP